MKSLLLFSGGYDSAAVLDIALKNGDEVICMFVDYGQPYAAQEYAAAMYAFKHYENRKYAVEFMFQSMNLGLTGEDYVPYRNLVLTTLGVNVAAANGCRSVLVGSKSAFVREGDSHSFKDSSKPFYDDLRSLVISATEDGHIAPLIEMPVVGWSKPAIIKRVHDAGIELQMLWSCYLGGESNLPCGTCHACTVMREAIVEAGLEKQYSQMAKGA